MSVLQVFELQLLHSVYKADEWRHFIHVISDHVKGLHPLTIDVLFQENLVRFFVSSKADISSITSGIEGLLISTAKQQDANNIHTLPVGQKIAFLKIPTGASLLELKERYKVQESKDLVRFRLEIQRLKKPKHLSKMTVWFKVSDAMFVAKRQLALVPVHILEVNFADNVRYVQKTHEPYLNIEKSLNLLVSEGYNALFRVDGFPFFQRDYFMPLRSFEFDRHGLILGQSGSGKSKFIELLISKIYQANMEDYYRVVVIDPHASIALELMHIASQQVIDFKANSSDIFPQTSDATSSTELSSALFKSLMGSSYNTHVERVVRFSLYVLYSGQRMSFTALKNFLSDLEYRKSVLDELQPVLPPNIVQFFHTDFNELRTKYYNEAVLPVISLIDEMALLPGINQPANISLLQTLQESFLTTFSLSKVGMGEKVVKTVAGLLIQNIFQLAQSRVFNRKIILIIDEVSVVQNPTLASILSEARKFNLSVILSQQYLGQVEKDLRDAIFANTYNYFVFKVSEEDAKIFEGNLQIELPQEIMKEAKQRGLKEQDVRIKILTGLSSRECLSRVYANGQFYPCVKTRTIDVNEVKQQIVTALQREGVS